MPQIDAAVLSAVQRAKAGDVKLLRELFETNKINQDVYDFLLKEIKMQNMQASSELLRAKDELFKKVKAGVKSASKETVTKKTLLVSNLQNYFNFLNKIRNEGKVQPVNKPAEDSNA